MCGPVGTCLRRTRPYVYLHCGHVLMAAQALLRSRRSVTVVSDASAFMGCFSMNSALYLEQCVEGGNFRFEATLLEMPEHGERMLQLLSPRTDGDHGRRDADVGWQTLLGHS